MPAYAYRIWDAKGLFFEGIIEAETTRDAAIILQKQGFYVVRITKSQRISQLWQWLSNKFSGKQKITSKQMAFFCRQLSTLIDGGVPLYSGLILLANQGNHPLFQQTLFQVAQKIHEGISLSAAMKGHPKFFPELFVHMVEAGEVGGVLDGVLSRLAAYYDKESETERKVRMAMLYPLLVFVLALASILFFLLFSLPTFAKVLMSLGIPLPKMTKLTLATVEMVKKYGFLWGMLPVASFIALRKASKNPRWEVETEKLILGLPLIGELRRQTVVARMSRMLSMLLSNGMHLMQSLHIVRQVSGNPLMAQAVQFIEEGIRKGQTMTEMMQISGLFPPLLLQMVFVGEESGNMDGLLAKAADYYETEVDYNTGRTMALLEPLLLIFLATVVGFLAVSMLLPMFEAISKI
ncbi:type II secretion system F family protein [Heliobacterium chlorum]|uniref:Type II secretion system F family protein n=1 Tax=Heliobacterium chlorum TaxID=2698 RepID=A0ABR7T5V6_HELCL|nr:type II secretion system F family protein [Heliobacterium chlorum]MBC9784926.1 type II secretion system F family protein [Heliobacterium chlorum]